MSVFELTQADKRSPVWRAIVEHLQTRVVQLRAQNDTSQSVEKTEHLRGRIAELKALLALDEERRHDD